MLGWGGFSARAHASGQSPLARLASGEAAFDPRVNLLEDLRGAGVPQFQSDGFLRPARLQLVREGAYAGTLVSPRSAREFGLPGNGACDAESPEALSLSAGDLDEQHALRRLGTGIAVSNLWYLNFSDRHACRITGLTRFATTWVQDGEIAGPVDVMRFDDSLYRVLGEELEALTNRAHRFPNTDTYDGRTFGAATAPGALLRGLSLTL
jgi:predicted Zn-dependent protease